MSDRDDETGECAFCGENVTPVNRRVEYHVCTYCLEYSVQVANRTPTHEVDGEEIN